jgi:precorrin-6A/cobalt-precorrin-6A reductase
MMPKKILLLGGTSETAPIASALAGAGYSVLVSTATDEPLELPAHPGICRRCGRLDAAGMVDLLSEQRIALIVDAAHPYATAAHATAVQAARAAGVPCLRFVRRGLEYPEPSTQYPEASSQKPASGAQHESGSAAFTGYSLHWADDHATAAALAFSFGRTVLLTTGATNLAPYVEQSRLTGLPVAARVLPRAESMQACLRAGLPPERIITGKGPFSRQDNRRHIRQVQAGVIVTKDSGAAGGVEAKLQAAGDEGCQVVIVKRPADGGEPACATIADLLSAVTSTVPP